MTINKINTSNSEDPPTYAAGYTEIPFDENTENNHHNVNINHEIAVIDRYYVTNKPTFYYLKESIKMWTSDIVDSEGSKQYSCTSKNIKEKDKFIIYDIDDTPILNFYFDGNNYKKGYVCKGETRTEQLVTIEATSKLTDDIQSYRILIFNIITNENEELEMRFNKSTQCYYIYCNKGKEIETVIGTISMSKILRRDCTIKISPLIDTMLLISLGAIVVRLDNVKEMNKDKKTLYFNKCIKFSKKTIYTILFILILIAGCCYGIYNKDLNY